jgi:N-acetyl-anhydromuramyl-L-alanine amidase AmpD
MYENLKPIDFNKIKMLVLPDGQYVKEEYPKKQIVLHHTASGDNIEGIIADWAVTKERVATAFIIKRDGTPYQTFSSKYFAWHLGASNLSLEQRSIGIELASWGYLVKGNGTVQSIGGKMVKTIPGKFYADYGNIVECDVQEYKDGFRGHTYYEKYSNEQIITVGEILLFFKQKYNIPLTYNEDMWNVTKRALNGDPGIWAHVSYLPASMRTDIHPQPEMIEMIKTISKL